MGYPMFAPSPDPGSVYGQMGPSLTAVPSTTTPSTPADAVTVAPHRGNTNGRPVDGEPGAVAGPLNGMKWGQLADNPATFLVAAIGAAFLLARYAATGHI